jgi:hypothetical protein
VPCRSSEIAGAGDAGGGAAVISIQRMSPNLPARRESEQIPRFPAR